MGVCQVVPPVCGEKGGISVSVWKRRKENTEKESRRQDVLGTPSKATRDPLRIALYTWVEKKLQSTDTVSMMTKFREWWLHVPRSNHHPTDMYACKLVNPWLGIAWENTRNMP